MENMQPCMTEREDGLMSCFLPLALIQKKYSYVKQKTCTLLFPVANLNKDCSR